MQNVKDVQEVFHNIDPSSKKERVNFQTDYSNDTAAKNKKYQICFGCSVSSKLCLIFFSLFSSPLADCFD